MISRVSTLGWILLVCCGVSLPASAESDPTDEAPTYEMTTYQFVMLLRGPDQRPMGEREIVRHQGAHLEYLRSLHENGEAIIAGPLSRGGEIRGVVVLDAGSVEAAEEIMSKDPWVREGRITTEIHPWWAAKGIFQPAENLMHSEPCYLGLLKRPPNAPDYPDDKLQEIQEGHLANIRDMAASGDLVIAGPMEDDGVLRGILVFRTSDPERIRGLVARDPAVKMGRLGMELYPWRVPKGSLPPP